jgi:hypothetical protein
VAETREEQLARHKRGVKNLLREFPDGVAPGLLFDYMRNDGYDDATSRAALWYLIDWQEVTLTSGFTVRLNTLP